MSPDSAAAWMTAADAAALLRVSRATLYAYVSRGFLRSQPMPGATRERGYARDDVERLRRRTEERRNPDKAAARALQWGMPILESSITFIDGKRLYYRGHDVAMLARSRSVEEVASLVWTGRFDTPPSAALPARTRPARAGTGRLVKSGGLPFVGRAQSALAAAAARRSDGLRRPAIGRCIVRLAHSAPPHRDRVGRRVRRHGRDRSHACARVGRRGARRRCDPHRPDPLRRSRVERVVVHRPLRRFVRLEPVLGGDGRPGGARRTETRRRRRSRRVDVQRDAPDARNLRGAMAARLARGEPIDGFGHPLYPGGDPRASMLLDLLRERYAKSPELGFVLDFAAAASATLRERPNVDFALAARRARAAAAAGRAADDVRNRPDDRVDRTRDRAVRHRAADSAACEVRRCRARGSIATPV